jgi:hypothetical protein
LISEHLSKEERAVLNCLTEGLGSREIGRRLDMSHTMAVRHRGKIAEVLNRLDKHCTGQWQTFAKNCRVLVLPSQPKLDIERDLKRAQC